MKLDLKTLAQRKYLVKHKDGGMYVPAKDHIIMCGDIVVAFVNFDHDSGKWLVENLAGDDDTKLLPTTREFDVYKKVN